MRRRCTVWLGVMGLLGCGCSGSTTQDVLAASDPTAATATATPTGSPPATTTTAPPPVPFTNCDDEKEPNDVADKANTISGARCGQIATPKDVDFLAFKLKGSTRSMVLNFDGKVSIKVTVGKQSVTLGTGTGQKVPYVAGGAYLLEVAALEPGATPTWRVEVIETP